jgi:myo-inositol-1(or 4)-monophosphatase
MHAFLNTATKATLDAGRMMLHKFDRLDLLKVSEKAKNDFVSDADIKVEEYLVEKIKDAYPDHSILAEKSDHPDDSYAEYQWIIDPIDGTHNFVNGIPHFCISIAIKRDDKIEHALIYDPIRDETFSASRGRGAHLNNHRMRVSDKKEFDTALIGTGFPMTENPEHNQYSLNMFGQVLPACADVRCAGSAALDLAYVASGRLDGYFEQGLQIWDSAAGTLLIREAGGMVSDFAGGENYSDSGNIIAGNPKIFKALFQKLAPKIPTQWRK